NQIDSSGFGGRQFRGGWQSETDLRDGSNGRDDWGESGRRRERQRREARRDNSRERRSPCRDQSREFSNSQHDLRSWADTENKGSDGNRRKYHGRRGHYKEQQKVRHFNCGHWEKLDREASSRLVSNEFCSKCWPLTAQMQRNGLFSRPRDDDQVKRTMLSDTDPETSLEYIQ
uniref:Zinc finger, CCHC-type, retrotransposon Gag domain protein n=1 Tax=Macrostomum lignano TaxID=282301 RepID=A0A1I8GGL4_9PLAT